MTTRSWVRRWQAIATAFTLGAALALLAACAPQPVRPPQPSQPLPSQPGREAEAPPPSFPVDFYRDAARRGEPVFEVDPVRSLVVVEVRRSGSLARLGHDHVVASHDLRGYLAPDARRADLYVRLDRLTVDEPKLRAQAGFDTQPTAEDIAGTRHNMLGRVLDAEAHPYALIAVTRKAESSGLDVAITLNGVTRHVSVEAAIESGPGDYTVTGTLAFDQTDFGIRPFSLLGGALAVADRLDLRFSIRAHRIAELPAADR
ncbi:MAG TPA: YceI family protein [Casimicrobiaceae bacterium]|nr:YceI family protein [Casimicrobiaceae bacterium]